MGEPFVLKLMDLLNEGVFDKGILKAVFMAGGPGSGKSFVANGLFGIPKKVKLIRKRGLLTPIDDFTLELYFTKTQTSVITIDRTAHYKKKTIMIITKKNSYIWDDNELLKFNKETELYKTIFMGRFKTSKL